MAKNKGNEAMVLRVQAMVIPQSLASEHCRDCGGNGLFLGGRLASEQDIEWQCCPCVGRAVSFAVAGYQAQMMINAAVLDRRGDNAWAQRCNIGAVVFLVLGGIEILVGNQYAVGFAVSGFFAAAAVYFTYRHKAKVTAMGAVLKERLEKAAQIGASHVAAKH